MAKEDSKTVIRIRFIVPPLQGWLKPIIAIASRQRLNCAVTRPNWTPAFAHKHPGARLEAAHAPSDLRLEPPFSRRGLPSVIGGPTGCCCFRAMTVARLAVGSGPMANIF